MNNNITVYLDGNDEKPITVRAEVASDLFLIPECAVTKDQVLGILKELAAAGNRHLANAERAREEGQ